MTTAGHRSWAWRRVFLTLAVLALALKILVPPGFMAVASSQGAGPALVLCTGHGPVTLAAGEHGQPGEQKKTSTHDAPCAFAGHGASAPTPSLFAAGTAVFVAYRAQRPAPVRRSLAPGRGLAAPPLPARGPPSLST